MQGILPDQPRIHPPYTRRNSNCRLPRQGKANNPAPASGAPSRQCGKLTALELVSRILRLDFTVSTILSPPSASLFWSPSCPQIQMIPHSFSNPNMNIWELVLHPLFFCPLSGTQFSKILAFKQKSARAPTAAPPPPCNTPRPLLFELGGALA